MNLLTLVVDIHPQKLLCELQKVNPFSSVVNIFHPLKARA